jgi:hypothetical protein
VLVPRLIGFPSRRRRPCTFLRWRKRGVDVHDDCWDTNNFVSRTTWKTSLVCSTWFSSCVLRKDESNYNMMASISADLRMNMVSRSKIYRKK